MVGTYRTEAGTVEVRPRTLARSDSCWPGKYGKENSAFSSSGRKKSSQCESRIARGERARTGDRFSCGLGFYGANCCRCGWVAESAEHAPDGVEDFALRYFEAMAAWFGLLATCLNLFPIWQLDGGHIAYAVLGGRAQKKLSVACALVLVAVSFAGWPVPSYLVFGLLLLVLGMRFRFYHPPTLYDGEELGPGRRFLSVVALVILIVSFTPVPITIL